MKQLAGKVAVVTGGASGIGKGIARRLVAHGMDVVIADIESDKAQATAEEIGAIGIQVDVTQPSSVKALADATIERFGKVHLVCNNAGIGPFAPVADLTLDDWRWMLDVNLWGVIHGIHYFLPLLRKHGDGGHIVNTASLAALTAMPGLGAYTASKAGVVALSEALAKEMEASDSTVGVSVLLPGTVKTNIADSLRNRPRTAALGKLTDLDIGSTELGTRNPKLRWLDPDDVGEIVVQAVIDNELYAFTHPEMFSGAQARFATLQRANERAAAREAAA